MGLHEAFGFPLSWRKVAAGLNQNRVGFAISLTRWTIGTTQARMADLLLRAKSILTTRSGPRQALESLVGKLGQLLQALGKLRP